MTMSNGNAKTTDQSKASALVPLTMLVVATAFLLSACTSSNTSSSSSAYSTGGGVTGTSSKFDDANYRGRRFYGFRPH